MHSRLETEAARRRIEEVGLLLRWEGRLNRARIMELYGLSPVRASELIREFREAHPDATQWDSRSRSFIAAESAYAGIAPGDGLDWYLARTGLQAATPSAKSADVLWAASSDFSRPDPRIFAMVLRAAQDRRRLEIFYRSMGEPKPHPRLVEPHSMVRAGRRWHVRALSLEHGEFRDFSLGRIVRVKRSGEPSQSSVQDDPGWNAQVKVALIAHPRLSPEQAEVVRHEFFRGTARRTETCRGALAQYLIQDVRAATDTAVQLPPDYQLAVENFEEVAPWLFPR
jgi:hypothetical protein